jgi:copper chaperone CopZ
MKTYIPTSMTALTLMAGLTLVTPAFAAESHEGMHKMPDGTWMNNHTMTKEEPAKVTTQATTPTGYTVIATVNGLVCDFCAQSVHKTLMKEPGVTDAKVDLSAKTVTVSLKDGAKLEEAHLGKLLKDAGYDMTSYKAE